MNSESDHVELDIEGTGSGLWDIIKTWGLGLAVALAAWWLLGWIRRPDLPDLAPDFDLPALDGGRVSLSGLRGREVVVNFWAAWCGPCRAEIPAFSRFATEHPEISVLGIATDGSPASLRKAREELGISYPILIADGPTLSAYGIDTIPTTVVVAPDGRVETVRVGPMMEWQLERLADQE